MNKKILILYTSVGLGHKFIALNLGFHLRKAGFEVLEHDILQVQEGAMVDFGVWLHSLINRRFPFVWRWLYFSNLVNAIGLPLRVPLAKTNSENLLKIVDEFKPDVILSTQTTGSAATASLIEQKKFDGKFVIAFSDFHLHKFWLYDQAGVYIANIPEQKAEMIKLGIPAEKIFVCGITLQPKPEVQELELKQQLGIPAQDKLVVFGSGSLGIGFDEDLLVDYLELLTSVQEDLSVVVLCGKNSLLKNKLDGLKIPKVFPQGFFEKPSRLYQIADCLVTKPGGLTISEALQAKCKILITHTLPGQEEPNYDYLLTRNLVYPFPDPLTSENLVEQTLRVITDSRPQESASSDQITQNGHEGEEVVKAISALFH